jgi:alkanesulfonate monooxygenase SsuD/methylene tetrahydromethanopterin reductase-like flavin-dependent oxidoreductase (luciferase family)
VTTFGYWLSSEEHPPLDLVRNARRAEEAGFEFALISDHFHPWIDAQGHSPFVWSVIGGIAATTERIRLGTGVTCRRSGSTRRSSPRRRPRAARCSGGASSSASALART